MDPNLYGLRNRDLILCIIQIITLRNAMNLGWKITKIGEKKYELSKKLSEISNFNLRIFLNDITNISVLW